MQKGWRIFYGVGLVVLFLWSFYLRFAHFGAVPTGLYWDETAILVDARSIAQTGHDMHGRPWYQIIYPSYGDYKLPVYIWLAGASVKLLGATEQAVRVPSAIAGLVSIGLAGWIVKSLLELELSNKTSEKKQVTFHFSLSNFAGVMSSLTLALSPWSILFSRTGFEANLAQAFLAAGILCAILGQKKPWLLYLSPIFGLLATYTYFSARYVWLGVFVAFSVITLLPIFSKLLERSNTAKKNGLRKIIFLTGVKCFLPLLIFTVGLWPMIHSPLYAASNTFRLSTDSVLQTTPAVLQSNIYRELAGNTRLDRVAFSHWWLTAKNLLSNYSDNLSLNFIFVTGDPNLRHGTGEHGLFLLVALPFFLLGWYALFRRYPRMFLFLLSWWLLALLPASVPNTTPHALRSLNALVPLSGVIGIGLAMGFKKVQDWDKITRWRPFVWMAGGLLLTLNVLQFSFFYFNNYPELSSSAWQSGYKQVALLTFAQRTNNQLVLVLPFDDRFYLWLLLYGPYTSKEVQAFPESGFQIRDFAGIYTDHLPSSLNAPGIVAGTKDQVQQFTDQHHYRITAQQYVVVPNQTQFEVAQIQAKP